MAVWILDFASLGEAHSEVNFGASEGWVFCKFHKQTFKDGIIINGLWCGCSLEAFEVARGRSSPRTSTTKDADWRVSEPWKQEQENKNKN